jgi:hypothetical protein
MIENPAGLYWQFERKKPARGKAHKKPPIAPNKLLHATQ